MNNYSDKIAITTGDPNGIGAEITIKALKKLDMPSDKIVLVSNRKVLDFYGKLDKDYEIIEIPFNSEIHAGMVTKEGGEFSFQSLKKSFYIIAALYYSKADQNKKTNFLAFERCNFARDL